MMPDQTKPDEALAHYLSEWLNDAAPSSASGRRPAPG